MLLIPSSFVDTCPSLTGRSGSPPPPGPLLDRKLEDVVDPLRFIPFMLLEREDEEEAFTPAPVGEEKELLECDGCSGGRYDGEDVEAAPAPAPPPGTGGAGREGVKDAPFQDAILEGWS